MGKNSFVGGTLLLNSHSGFLHLQVCSLVAIRPRRIQKRIYKVSVIHVPDVVSQLYGLYLEFYHSM